MQLSENQIEYLRSLGYLSKGEIGDLILGFTDIEVLLDVDDLETFDKIDT